MIEVRTATEENCSVNGKRRNKRYCPSCKEALVISEKIASPLRIGGLLNSVQSNFNSFAARAIKLHFARVQRPIA
ncbi:unnamed protein product [Onchocerca flexuosa]|uniref:Transposase n=1 Tax=Onchocerca flexuosa TaxID=387005 RepID=A0A183I1K1_9BILA|nr:unnamed protein product [Onchocerca flexuosa]